MADPQPQSNDQGFLPGLLGKVRDFFPDPAAAYGGLLSDEATRRAFAWRELGAAAGAFSQGAMPVPYKGGIPFGATLGAAGAAASTAGDALMHARLEQAQQQQALANVGLSQQQVTLMQAALPGLKSLIATGQDRLSGGAGTGTGTDGKPLTGPAKILAGGGGSTVGGIGGPENAEIRTNNFAGMRVPGAAAGGPNTNPAGWQTFATPADGVQAIGNQLDRYAAGKTTGQPLTTLRQMVSTWAPPSENDTDALIKRASTVTGLDPDAPVDLSNPAVRAKVTEAFIRNEQGGNLHPKAVEGLSAVYGNVWSPHGGQAQTAAAPDAAPGPPTAPPMAPSAAPPGGLLKLPDPTSAAPPQLATPPAAGAPGPVTGLLGQQPMQQVAAADAPQLSPAAAAVLQGINRQQAGRGLLASGSVAGDNAVPTGGPSPAAVAQAGPPHTGAAGAAELAGLLAQQPAAAPPTATPYTSAPPVTGQGAPAPGPAPTGPPIAPPVNLPPVNLPPIPTQMPTMPNLPAVQPTPQQQIAQGVAGLMALSGHPAPPWIDDLAKMPAQMAMEQYKAWVGGQANMMTEQYKKQIEVAASGTISYLQSQNQLPADLTKMTNEQNLKLRNSMAEKGLEQKPDGSWGFMPGYVEQQGQLKKQEQDLQQQREIAVKNAEQTAIAQREQQNRDATLAQLPLQERQKALFTDYADNVQKPAGTADTARKTLAALGNSLSNFQTGATAPQRLEIAKMWSDAVTTLGVTPSPAVRQMIASGETIGKEGNTLGFELAKELGSRESQMVIQAAIASNPGLAMSPQGNAQLIKLLDNGLQRDIAKKSFYDQYFTANHTYEGADTAFRKVNPVEVTVSSVPGLEYHPKTPQDIAQYPPGTRYMRPDIPGKVFTVPPNG